MPKLLLGVPTKFLVSLTALFLLTFSAFSQTTLFDYNFNSSNEGWTASGGFTRDNSSFAGADGNHWRTTPFNNYPDNMTATVTSPVLDLTGASSLNFSIDIRYDTESAWDGWIVQYSTNSGSSWNTLGAQGQGTNWYNDGDVDAIANGQDGWSGNNGGWQTATISMPSALDDISTARIRILFQSDVSIGADGVAFDNVQISGFQINFSPNTSVHPGNVATNLALWLRSDHDVITDGANQVIAWGDQSGNSNHAYQLSGSNTPTYSTNRVNGNPVLEFDSDYVDGAAGFYTREFFVVIDPDFISSSSEDTGDVLGFEDPDFSGLELGPSTGSLTNELLTHTIGSSTEYRSGYTDPSGTVALSNPILVNDRINAAGNGQNIYLNGLRVDNAQANAGTFTSFSNEPYRLGNDFVLTDFYEGGILEVISYTTRLSDANRRDVATYLAIKYGITLDISTQAYTVGGSSIYNHTAYNQDIAGIGQNLATMGLSQTSSRSINPGSLITMSTPSDLADGEYLIWGNNGGTNTFTTSDVPSGVLQRLNKIWRVAEVAGDVGTVTFKVDLTNLGIDWRNSTVNLLVSPAGSTMPTDLSTATVVSGGVVASSNGMVTLTFTDVDFADGDYFTLGGDIQTTAPGGVLSNLSLWLKADAGVTTNGTSVLSWSDLSGNGGDVTQGDPADQPEVIAAGLNNNDVLYFNGDFMDGLRGFSTQDYYVVVKPDQTVTTGNSIGFTLGFEGGGFGGFYLGGQTDGFIANDVATHAYQDYRSAYSSGAGSLDDPVLVFNVRNNAAGNGFDILSNGVGINNAENATDYANLTSRYFRVGDNFLNSQAYSGQIAEIICYTARNSDADRRDIESYLALKYGITLDISTSGYTLSGTDIYNYTTHPNNIAGIAYNLDHGFQQANSMSSAADAVVGMSDASDFDSGEYLIWGHDGGSTNTPQSTELPAMLHERLPAEWRVDETGDVGTTTVRFYVGGIDDYASRWDAAEGYTLLVNSTGNFNTADQYAGSYISGDTVYFTRVTMNDGDFFTLSVPPILAPGGVDGSSLWLRADRGVTTSGSSVTNWANIIGTSSLTEVTQGAAASQPTLVDNVLNGQSVIRFDGVDDNLESGSAILGNVLFGTNELTTFFAGIPNGNGRIFDWRNNATTRAFLGLNGGVVRYVFPNNNTNGTGGRTESATSPSLSTPYLISSETDNNRNDIYLNGGATDGFKTLGGSTLNILSSSRLYLGQNDAGTGRLSGDFGELIFFDRALSGTERRQVETYQALKYGLTLDLTSSGYVVDGTTIFDAAGYANDIAGLAFDAQSGLVVRQATASSGNDIVTMRNPTALSQGDFLLWGHDNAALATSASGLPVGGTERLARTWAVDQTNSPGTTTVDFDLTGLGFGGYNLSDFLLVIDNDADFSNGVLRTITAQQFAGDVVTFVGANFSGATHFGLITQSDLISDTDLDGIPDYFEVAYGTNPNNGNDPVVGGAPLVDLNASIGVNGDDISDALETILIDNGATGPISRLTDTDGDGITDWLEVANGTDPFLAASPSANGDADTDGDGLPDALEDMIFAQNGGVAADLSTDTDGDGVPDYYEVLNKMDPADANDPQSGGGGAADVSVLTGPAGDNISDALEVALIDGGAIGPITTATDSDGDGLPDFVEALTNTDPFNAASPTVPSSPSVRILQADYSVGGSNCEDLSGYQWVHVMDNNGRLVYSINPVGNNLGSTCWGVRIVNGSGNVRLNSQRYAVNRNWWISPTTQPTGFPVYVRYYVLNQEMADIRGRLVSDGFVPAELETFISNKIDLVKTSGIETLDCWPTVGSESALTWTLGSYGNTARTITAGYPSFSSTRLQSDATQPLPIELMYFRAFPEGEAVTLRWETAWERDNDYFTIERRREGEDWQEIATVPGAGNDGDGRAYNYLDEPKSGDYVLYYRLKQTDYDGTYTYSDVVSLLWQRGALWPVYPNPAHDLLSVRLDKNDIETAEVQLFTMAGKAVYTQASQEGEVVQLQLANLPAGVYLLEIRTDSRRQVTRVLIE